MSVNSDRNEYSPLSISRKSTNFNKKLRIYHTNLHFIDIELEELNSETFFVKDKKNFAPIKEILSDKFFEFIDKFTDADYLSFLQEKNFVDLTVDIDKSFPGICIRSFQRDSYFDSSTQMDFSTSALLDISTVNAKNCSYVDTKQHSDDVLIEENNDEPVINNEVNFDRKESCNVIQVKKADKQERKKANRRKKKTVKLNELKEIPFPKEIYKLFHEPNKPDDNKKDCVQEIADISNEKALEQKKYSSALCPEFENLSVKTDFFQYSLEKETYYKKPLVKILEKIEEKIQRLNNGEKMEDFVEQQIDMNIFYCEKNSEGKIEGHGKYLYTENSISSCKMGNFINGKLDGVGLQVPIKTYLKKGGCPTTNIPLQYKIGIWENNELVKGLQCKMHFEKSLVTFSIGEMKKDKLKGEAIKITFKVKDDTETLDNVSFYDIIKHLDPCYVECGNFKEDLLHGRGKTLFLIQSNQFSNLQHNMSSKAGMRRTMILRKNHIGIKDQYKPPSIIEGLIKCLAFVWEHNGEYVNGKCEGYGKLVEQDNGKVCEGYFSNDKLNGYGTEIQENNIRYEGEFKDDQYNGFGKLVFPDNFSYEGDFAEDCFEGKGKLIGSNGEIYVGGWSDNQREGYGVFIYENKVKYEGTWIKNRKKTGISVGPDGSRYEGNWNDTYGFTGIGKITYNCGSIYEGGFVNSIIHGKGKMINKEGNIQGGDFVGDPKNNTDIETTQNFVFEGYFKSGKKNEESGLLEPEVLLEKFRIVYKYGKLVSKDTLEDANIPHILCGCDDSKQLQNSTLVNTS